MTGTLLSPCPVLATVTNKNMTPLSELDIAPVLRSFQRTYKSLQGSATLGRLVVKPYGCCGLQMEILQTEKHVKLQNCLSIDRTDAQVYDKLLLRAQFLQELEFSQTPFPDF